MAMTMRFCPKCGNLMVLRTVGNSYIFYCMRCGYRMEVSKDSVMLKRSISFEKHLEKREEVAVGIPPGAIFAESIVCPRCRKNGVYYWRKQASSAESSDTIAKVYKCASCGYMWTELE
uniref:TFIIS-type domain-containing protein n=1 Tax=Ignisphaera aggregans TaxID=334771 RepID=A0A7J2U0F4_9CREN